MAKVWLVAVQWDGAIAIIGKEKLLLEPAERRERFLSSLQGVHPRLLLLFKAAMLLDDEAAAACGVDELPFSLETDESVCLAMNGLPEAGSDEPPVWPLSHCAEAYLNRLLPPAEAAKLLTDAEVEPEAQSWLEFMLSWLRAGRLVILLREDGRV